MQPITTHSYVVAKRALLRSSSWALIAWLDYLFPTWQIKLEHQVEGNHACKVACGASDQEEAEPRKFCLQQNETKPLLVSE